MHILLVEPNVLLAESYQAALTEAGHSLSWAQSAQQAVYRADEHLPGMVIVELQIARHNGIELLYELKSYTEWQSIPVIILTSLPKGMLEALPVLREQLGVVAVLTKSQTSLNRLCQEVEKIAHAEKVR